MMEKKSFVRKRYWINPGLQGGLILNVFAIAGGVLFLSCLALILLSSRELTESLFTRVHLMKNTREAFLPLVLKVGGISLAVAFVAVAVRFLFYTHRIAGPMYRIKDSLSRLRQGDLKYRTSLRKHDELKDLAEDLNGLAVELTQRVQSMRREHASIAKLLEKKKPSAAELARLKRAAEALGGQLDRFQV